MSIKKRTAKKFLIVSKKIEEYKNTKNFDTLNNIDDEYYNLLNLYNKEIGSIETKVYNSLTVKYALAQKKLVLSYESLKNYCRQYQILTKSKITNSNFSEIEINEYNKNNKEILLNNLYVNIYNTVTKEAIKKNNNDEYLNQLKARFHTLAHYYAFNNIQHSMDTNSIYDEKPWNQLIEMFDSKNFYKLSKEELVQLTQAVSNKYCEMNNVNKVPVIINSKIRALGKYYTFGNYVNLTNDYFDLFNYIKNTGIDNKLLPYKILSTTLHEARHSYQFRTNTSKDKKEERYMINCVHINKHYLLRVYYGNINEVFDNMSKYYSRVSEMDANDASYKTIRDLSKESLKNNEELEKYFIKAMTDPYNSKDSVIYEIASLLKDKGLTPDLYQRIFETMTTLNLIDKNHIIYKDKKEINYEKSVEDNIRSINAFKLKLGLFKEISLRSERFETVCNREQVLRDMAKEKNVPVNTLIDDTTEFYKDDQKQLDEICTEMYIDM